MSSKEGGKYRGAAPRQYARCEGCPWIPHHMTSGSQQVGFVLAYCGKKAAWHLSRYPRASPTADFNYRLSNGGPLISTTVQEALVGATRSIRRTGVIGTAAAPGETMQLRERALLCGMVPRSYPQVYLHTPAWDRLGSTQDVNLLTKPRDRGRNKIFNGSQSSM